ncbi:MAG: AAA family ATPase [Microbacterium sp.]|uniref:phosphatase domain-containing protein n=1 Tax=Microbacterium sp. TaxID=51671 RepID=UPI0025F80756|nr:AAA family ATPase [Microbacterium sp.]MBQ9917409.1 AAA family ATPase [Microbacterium sp.]
MPTLHLTRGIPGSGKSTFAKQWVQEDPEGRVRINRDDLRGMMFATDSKLLSPEQERQVSNVEKSAARAALNAGKDVIIDATNLRSRYVREWFTLGFPVRFHDFPVELHIALARNATRENPIPREAIEKMFTRATLNGALPPAPVGDPVTGRPYEQDWDLPSAYIVDVDGTLAHMNGRSPYDWGRVDEDTVDPAVRDMVNALEQGHNIVLLSGRDSIARALTEKWLTDNFIRYDELHMRAAGDSRRDTVVKRELFDAHIRDRFNVMGAIDDRPSVCRFWRSIGVKTFQVGDPHHEF